ncbi:MAG: hypothetical protein WBB84_00310, partial [Candidatus Omnitrophota bacterium]
YKTDIREVAGAPYIVVANMRLDWFNWNERPVQTIADIMTVGIFANKRWSNSVRGGAPELAELINSKKYEIIMGPGVNSSGISDKKLKLIAAELKLKGNQTLVVLHSAFTELGARAMPLITRDKSEVFYLVLSPRMDDSTYASWMKSGMVPPSNVLSINSRKDFPHWSDWSVLSIPVKNFTSFFIFYDSTAVLRARNSIIGNSSKFWHDYDHNRNAGLHVFISDENIDKGGSKDLAHGCMLNGLTNNRKYVTIINGYQKRERVDLLSLVNMWLLGELNKFNRKDK